ncbi:MAG TPA: 4-(cytidine 5'-diphospho)-2-C-methyl-D-erythritol kinase [Gemmataceae bacterium]|jgi:4-diphosphocytidyl-2-C-methyl-D-erythritol kinase|nr:4-(cytidine 5'-diphospho)-2-C-methyl-D-erythritol kinase [Gemmataceae bacterium]
MDSFLSLDLPAMLAERQSQGLIIRTPAKVNLFLEVHAKRPDGYHDIATLMVAISLFDTLHFQDNSAGAITLTCSRPDLSTGPDNLIVRAAQLLQRKTGSSRGVRIHLEKRIPLAAGLAGGSSDAAATLAGLNQLWNLGLSRNQLADLASELGSDIPFFFYAPAAWCTGRGEIVEPLPIRQPLFLVLISPPVGLSTAEVYRGVVIPADPCSGLDIREALGSGDMDSLGRSLHNRLQARAQQLCPSVSTWLDQLARLNPAGQLMSGSGATLFALCRNLSEAYRVARALVAGLKDEPQTRVQIVRTC